MQPTKRQREILIAAVDKYQAQFDGDDEWEEDGRAGPSPSAHEVDEVARLVRELVVSDAEPAGYKGPMKNGKPYVTDNESVINALLLTDAGMSVANPIGNSDIELVEKTVAGWTDDEKAAAFEWAACSHLRAGDNDDVVVPPCPPHVKAIRPKYGKK